MPMQRRFPKKGFKNHFRKEVFAVNLKRPRRSLRRRHRSTSRACTTLASCRARRTRSRSWARVTSTRSSSSRPARSRARPKKRSKKPAVPPKWSPASWKQARNSMASGFQNIGKIPELRKRIFYTITLLAVYRIGAFVTTPGVNRAIMAKIVNQASGIVPGPLQHVLGRRARADVDLRARHHAVHQRVDHSAVADGRRPQAGAGPEGRARWGGGGSTSTRAMGA